MFEQVILPSASQRAAWSSRKISVNLNDGNIEGAIQIRSDTFLALLSYFFVKMLISTIFDKCSNNEVSVDTFVAYIFYCWITLLLFSISPTDYHDMLNDPQTQKVKNWFSTIFWEFQGPPGPSLFPFGPFSPHWSTMIYFPNWRVKLNDWMKFNLSPFDRK